MNTETEIDKAIKFLNNYKSYFQLDEDDIQELLITFYKGYNSESGAVSTFLVTAIRNYNINKWRKKARIKHAHTAVSLDKVTDDDERNWLQAKMASVDPTYELISDEERVSKLLLLGMTCLTKKQRVIIEMLFFDGIGSTEIAKRLKITNQCVNNHKKLSISKMKVFFEKNNIKITF